MDPFETFALPLQFNIDKAELERRYKELQRALHPDRLINASPAERRLSAGQVVTVNDAYRILKDDLARAEALLKLLGDSVPDSGNHAAADSEFLMEIMELRESLQDARKAGALDKVRNLTERVNKAYQANLAALHEQFPLLAQDMGETSETHARLAAAVAKLRYYRRFLDESSVIEDDLAM